MTNLNTIKKLIDTKNKLETCQNREFEIKKIKKENKKNFYILIITLITLPCILLGMEMIKIFMQIQIDKYNSNIEFQILFFLLTISSIVFVVFVLGQTIHGFFNLKNGIKKEKEEKDLYEDEKESKKIEKLQKEIKTYETEILNSDDLLKKIISYDFYEIVEKEEFKKKILEDEQLLNFVNKNKNSLSFSIINKIAIKEEKKLKKPIFRQIK